MRLELQLKKALKPSFTPVNRGLLQRQCACGQHAPAGLECDSCKRKNDSFALQRAAVNGTKSDTVPPIVHDVLRSSGQPLDSTTRAMMEPRFGHDFSHVRVHTDARAAESARAVNANAYTVGKHMVFDAGQYAPMTHSGQQLLAHELTHVMQQRNGTAKHEVETRPALQDTSSSTLESEALQNAARIGIYAGRMTVSRSALPVIQRVGSGLAPSAPRSYADLEAQRLEAIKIVSDNCLKISAAASKYGVSWEAIAGAILWEALENPYFRPFKRLGPGKVHVTEWSGKSEAAKVEDEKRVTPPSKDSDELAKRLQQTGWAITYIAAIMQRHADNYKKIAGVDITNNPGALCTLYQGGKSEERAKKLADRRKTDPKAQPIAADEMGPWVEKNMSFIRDLCILGDIVPPSGSTRVV